MTLATAVSILVAMTAATPAAGSQQELEQILKELRDLGVTIDRAPHQRVILGVDCTEPFVISLPVNVLTECEAMPPSAGAR